MAEGELPRAVAAGTNAQLVRAPRAALIAGVLVAIFVYVLFSVREVPARAVALTGGSGRGVARWGGVVGTYVPPPNVTPEIGDDDPNLTIRRRGDVYTVELARVTEHDAPDVIARLSAGGGLEFREVIESRAMKGVEDLGLAHERRAHDDWIIEPLIEVDYWRVEDHPEQHTDLYLYAHDRTKIEHALAEAKRQGWSPPPNTEVAYEPIAPAPEMTDQRMAWRTYLVSTTVALDGTDIMNAIATTDPYSQRPLIGLEFNRKGGAKFGDLTARIQGHKLATLLGGVVKSAPVINGPIRGGRAQISMGGGDPLKMEHERDVLVDVLKTGSLPLGGQLHDLVWVAPVEATRVAVARVLLALIVGALAFLASLAVIRIARPERARPDQLVADAKRPSLAGKVAWTAFPLVVYVIGTYLTVPGVNEVELTHIITKGRSHLDLTLFSVFSLGLMPLLTAFVSVEIFASIVPRWRKLRDTLRGRRKLELAVAIVAIALCCVQAYFVVTYMMSLSRGGAEIFNEHMRWPAMFTIAAGPMLIAVLASTITNRGIGNGYAVLFVFAWLWRNQWWDLPSLGATELVRVAVTIILVVTIARALLAWRIASPGRVAMPLPSASIAPLQDGGGVLMLIGTLSALGVTLPFSWLDAMQSIKHSLAIGVTVIVVFTAIWAYAFTRPGRRRAELAAAGFEPTDREQWTRGVLISSAGLGALFAIALLRPAPLLRSLADPALLLIATATIADLVAEWRARRKTELVAVWQLHDPLLVDAARSRLALADIPHFIQATRMRSLLWIFGSYVPMTVYAPTAHAEAAHVNMRTWLDLPERDAAEQTGDVRADADLGR